MSQFSPEATQVLLLCFKYCRTVAQHAERVHHFEVDMNSEGLNEYAWKNMVAVDHREHITDEASFEKYLADCDNVIVNTKPETVTDNLKVIQAAVFAYKSVLWFYVRRIRDRSEWDKIIKEIKRFATSEVEARKRNQGHAQHGDLGVNTQVQSQLDLTAQLSNLSLQ